MTFLPQTPIVRRTRAASAAAAGGDVCLQELYQARLVAARFVQANPAVLPIFERIEKEILAREAKMQSLARAAAALETAPYIDAIPATP